MFKNDIDLPEEAAARQVTPVSRVKVVGVEMTFMEMVTLLIKFAFAVIPAALIVAFIWAVIIAVVGPTFGLMT